MTTATDDVVAKLNACKTAEDVFGDLKQDDPYRMKRVVSRIFGRLSKAVHPDLISNDPEATEAFKLLVRFKAEADRKIDKHTYGDKKPDVDDTSSERPVIYTKKNAYVVEDQIASGDIANLYSCSFIKDGVTTPAVMKVARQPRDNDLMQAEAAALKALHKSEDEAEFGVFVPWLVDSFSYAEAGSGIQRSANVLNPLDGFYTLEQVREAYPDGVHPRDAAWMMRRMLLVIGFARDAGYVHGAILPSHVMIKPDVHGLVLTDWTAAVRTGTPLKIASPKYKDWYPKEVSAKDPATVATDLFMAGECFSYLMGGSGLMMLGSSLKAFRAFFRALTLPDPSQRTHNPFDVLQHFDGILEELWGPRSFHVFEMPGG